MNLDKNKVYIIIAVTIAVIFLAAFIALKSDSVLNAIENFDIDSIRIYILSFGILAPIVFILLNVLHTVVPLIPGFIIVGVGGLIWGVYLGTLLSIIGVFSGSLICFFLAKEIGRPFVESLEKKEDREITDRFFQKYGFWAILALRLIPVMSFDIISYGAGLTKIDFKKYAAATLIGMIPGTMLYTYLGYKIVDNLLLVGIISLVLLIMLLNLGLIKRLVMKAFGHNPYAKD